jgi:Tol biopolymer transport system component
VIGTTLGQYTITAKLGEGGMGEVYRATDPRLARDVAIKVLPRSLATDPKALARFEAEARAVAALSHPNILGIYDLGREGETVFAVTELIEGQTLRERIERDGALPLRETLDLGAQVARGLAAAHEKGIVHRDVKPANLLVAHDGRIKILDFGLAKQAAPADSQSRIAAAPTMGPGTEPGTVLGTVGYMAPEQVRGEPADERSDIFALGVVLYEMATGERAFAGETGPETMTAILRHEPRQLGVPESPIPPGLERVVRHCLEKNPRQRFRSAEDLAFALESLSGGSSSQRSGGVAAVAERTSRRRPALAAAAALALLGAGGVGGWLLSRGPSAGGAAAAAGVVRPTFRQLTKTPGGEGSPSLAPDGESFVFVKRDGEDLDLFSQRIDGAKAIPLTAECEADDLDPAFSPDGRSIAFRSECEGGGVFVMGATGESRRRVADFGYGPAWSPDGRELAVVSEVLDSPTSRNSFSELWVVRVDSGERRRVSDQDAMGPTWSPDGKRIAFWGLRGDSFQRDLWSVAADGSERAVEAAQSISDDPPLDWAPVYSRDGRWLYFISTRGGTFNLWRVAIDAASGRPRGEPEPVTAPSSSVWTFALSADGRRLAFTDRNMEGEIVRAPFDVARRALAGPPAAAFSGSFELREQKLSPDGEWILFVNEDLPQHLHLVRTDGTGYRQLTDGPDRNRQGEWSPRADWIVFQTSRGDSSLAVVRPDGGGWQSLPVGYGLTTPRWSPDGSTISAFNTAEGGLLFDVSGGFGAPVRRELPPVSEGLLFWPTAWSSDGALLAGRATREGRLGDIAVRSMATGEYRMLPGTSGARDDFNMTFVDDRHLVYTSDQALWILDALGGAQTRIYSPPAGRRVANLSATSDGRWLTWIERADESDIWLVTLDEPAPAGARVLPSPLP